MYIHQALRLPTGKANGIYKDSIPEALMVAVLKEMQARSGVLPDELILANAFGTGGNMGRYASLLAGFPEEIPVTTIDSQCSGGLRAIELSCAVISSGNAERVIAGGMESHSMAPLKSYREGDPRKKGPYYTTAAFAPGEPAVDESAAGGQDTLLKAAENTALKHRIPKAEMLRWTQDSHRKAADPEVQNLLSRFIHRLAPQHRDQSIRSGTNFSTLSTAELIDRTVSAHYNDGAAAVMLENRPENALAKIVATYTTGWDPRFAPEAVLPAAAGVLKKAGLTADDIDIFEVNESFSLIPAIFAKEFNVRPDRINVLGGNLAYGHPFGASGTINLIHLVAALKWKNAKCGLVVLPAAGGLATAMIIENVF